MFAIPFLIFGAIVCLMRGRDRSPGPASPTLALAAPPVVPVVTSGIPSPIAVMGECLRLGQRPPPLVISCAIAEAESIGRPDVAEQIVRAFVLPVVLAAEHAHAAHVQASRAAMMPPAPMPPPMMVHMASMNPMGPTHAPSPTYPVEYQDLTSSPMFPSPSSSSSPPTPPTPPAESVMQHRAVPPRNNATTLTVSGKSSPIAGVDTKAWGAFVDRVSRELPTFTAARHVGRFRQRRDRLRELGIDERTVVDSPDGQLAAFEADMADAYHHAYQSGTLDEYVGGSVQVIVDGRPHVIQVTRSGMLGVIQAAGLDGAVGWFEEPSDRVRFPHTTHAFLRTNGVF